MRFDGLLKLWFIFALATLVIASSNPEPETTAGPTTEPENQAVSAEPSPEPSNEDATPETSGEKQKATTSEIIVPPIVLIVIIVSGLGSLMASSILRRNAKRMERRVHQRFLSRKSVKSIHNLKLKGSVHAAKRGEAGKTSVDEIKLRMTGSEAFFEESDIEAIDTLYSFFNQPVQLIMIALPALVSLALCPLVLFMYAPMTDFFWPRGQYPDGPPSINEAIACFLAPAGLVYATSFGFSFQGAMQKQRELLNNISLEVGLLDQIMILVSSMDVLTVKERLQIFRIVKEEAVSIILQIQGRVRYSSNDYRSDRCSGQVWKIVKLLQNAGERQKGWSPDRLITGKLLDHIMHLNAACSDRGETLQAAIHPLKWLFLECLGFFSFFGVLLLQAQSYRMELAMCVITVFSISLLCYVVADLDSPFNGFFKVNLSSLIEIIDKAEDMYLSTLDGKDPYQMRANHHLNNSANLPVADDDDDDNDDDDDENDDDGESCQLSDEQTTHSAKVIIHDGHDEDEGDSD